MDGATLTRKNLKSQKNDAADAEPICEAVQRPTMRLVPINMVDQQAAPILDLPRNVDRLVEILAVRGKGSPALAKQMLGILTDQLCDVAGRVKGVECQLLV